MDWEISVAGGWLVTCFGRPTCSARLRPLRVPGDLPQVAVGVVEVAGIAAPEPVAGGVRDDGAGGRGLAHHRVDLFLGGDIVADRDGTQPAGGRGDPRFLGERCAGIERQDQPARELEEGDGAVIELLPDDALGRQAEAVAVVGRGALEIVDGQGKQGDLGLYVVSSQGENVSLPWPCWA